MEHIVSTQIVRIDRIARNASGNFDVEYTAAEGVLPLSPSGQVVEVSADQLNDLSVGVIDPTTMLLAVMRTKIAADPTLSNLQQFKGMYVSLTTGTALTLNTGITQVQ